MAEYTREQDLFATFTGLVQGAADTFFRALADAKQACVDERYPELASAAGTALAELRQVARNEVLLELLQRRFGKLPQDEAVDVLRANEETSNARLERLLTADSLASVLAP